MPSPAPFDKHYVFTPMSQLMAQNPRHSGWNDLPPHILQQTRALMESSQESKMID